MNTIPISSERSFLFMPCAHVSIGATVETCVSEEQARQAIDRLARRHPLLGATIFMDKNGKANYMLDGECIIIPQIRHAKTGAPSEIYTWLYENDRQSFDLERGPLMRVLLLRETRTTHVVLLAHHILGDGLSLVFLLRDFLSALDGTLDDAILAPSIIGDVSHFQKNACLDLPLKLFVKTCNGIYRKTGKRYSFSDAYGNHRNVWISREPRVLFHMMTPEETSIAIRNCRTHGLTVNEGIVMAFWMARHLKVGCSKLICIPVNVRNDLLRHPGESVGNFVSAVCVAEEYRESLDFWQNAMRLKIRLDAQIKNDKNRTRGLVLYNALDDGLCDALNFPPRHPAVKLLEPYLVGTKHKWLGITNVGKHTLFYRSFVVRDVWFAPSLYGMGGEMVVGVVTVGGQMSFCVRYGAAENKRADVEWILSRAKSLMLGEFGKI